MEAHVRDRNGRAMDYSRLGAGLAAAGLASGFASSHFEFGERVGRAG